MAEESKAEAVSEVEVEDESGKATDVAMPPAAKVPPEALDMAEQRAAVAAPAQPPTVGSNPPEQDLDGPRKSLVPLPEGYSTKLRSSNPPGALRRSSKPSRRRVSDPVRAGLSKNMAEAAPADQERISKPGVVMPMRIIDVNKNAGPRAAKQPPGAQPAVPQAPIQQPSVPPLAATPVQGDVQSPAAPAPMPSAAPANQAVVAPQTALPHTVAPVVPQAASVTGAVADPPPVPSAGPSLDELAAAPPPPPVQPPVPPTRPAAELALEAAPGELEAVVPVATPVSAQPPPPPIRAKSPSLPDADPVGPPEAAPPAIHTPSEGTADPLVDITQAPTPPDSPAAGRAIAANTAAAGGTTVSSPEAPTPPETPALRRELLQSIQERSAESTSRAEPPPLKKGPLSSSTAKEDESEDDIDVTVEFHDALEDELTEVEAISERELGAQAQKKKRLPPRPPPRTSFTDGSGEEGKRRQWWEELWNDDFLRAELESTAKEIHDEVNFIENSLAVDRGGVILDLACGGGAHSVEMSRRGYSVVGYDLSVTQLARAGELAQRNEQKISFLQGDVREMAFDQMFDGIFCWNASFGFFEEEKNLAILANVSKALKPGGSFLLDIPNRDFVVRQQPMQSWFEGDGCVCMDDMQVDFITSRLTVKRTVMLDDGRNREWVYSIRLYSLHELGKMLHELGFKVVQVSGQVATPGGFMGCYSPRVLVLAVKPAEPQGAST